MEGADNSTSILDKSSTQKSILDGIQMASGVLSENFTPATRLRVGCLNQHFGPDDFT